MYPARTSSDTLTPVDEGLPNENEAPAGTTSMMPEHAKNADEVFYLGPPLKFSASRFRRVIDWLWWTTYYTREYLIAAVGLAPSHTLRMFFYKHVFRMTIGPQTSIHRGCRFYNPRSVKIGSHTIISNDVLLDGRAQLLIGDNVGIAEGVAIFSLQHDLDDPLLGNRGGCVKIEDYAFIGSRAIILPGVVLGRGAAVGAGSIVTKSVEPYAVVVGAPARFVRYRSKDLQYQLNYRKFLG
jgi:acetyltransferase-like isoleucine patch superfamily enzyme